MLLACRRGWPPTTTSAATEGGGSLPTYVQCEISMAQQQSTWDRTLPGAETTTHVYARVGERKLRCLLHLPIAGVVESSSPESMPVIVWVHGSGFFGGTHLLGSPPAFTCPSFIAAGYAILQVEHRSSREPGGQFPAGLHDIKAAVRWLRHKATTDVALNLDPDRIGIWGASSGGWYSAMMAMLSSQTAPTVEGMSQSELEGHIGDHVGVSSAVCCAVDYFGPANFLVMDDQSERDKGHQLVHDGPESPESMFMGFPIQERPSLVQQANPAAYVSVGVPPVLIVHGNEDSLVPYHQSRLLHAALTQQRQSSQKSETRPWLLHIVEGGGHGERFDEDQQLIDKTFDFLEKYLKGCDKGNQPPPEQMNQGRL